MADVESGEPGGPELAEKESRRRAFPFPWLLLGIVVVALVFLTWRCSSDNSPKAPPTGPTLPTGPTTPTTLVPPSTSTTTPGGPGGGNGGGPGGGSGGGNGETGGPVSSVPRPPRVVGVELTDAAPGLTLADAVNNMAAGDRRQRIVDVRTRPGDHLVRLMITGTGPSVLLDDPRGLTVEIVGCPKPWRQYASDSSFVYACPGKETAMYRGSARLVSLGFRTPRNDATHLRFKLSLDQGATNTAQGQQASLAYRVSVVG